jgi:hypothetical protein
MSINLFKEKYGYEDNGFWYPRVTSICSIIAKPGLEKWLANHGSFFVMQKRRQKITDWGNMIDSLVKKLLQGNKIIIPSEAAPSIKAFLDFKERYNIDFIASDIKVKSEKNIYMGTLDVLCKIDNKKGILDIKTSVDFWDEQFLQTAAYFEAYNEKEKEKVETHWILRIDQYQECRKCGAKKREKSGVREIRGNNLKCSHVFGEVKGVCELKEVSNHETYAKAFFWAKKLWEFSNREILSKIENYPLNFKKQF